MKEEPHVYATRSLRHSSQREVAQSDYSKMDAEAKADENEAAKEYDKLVQDNVSSDVPLGLCGITSRRQNSRIFKGSLFHLKCEL